MLDNRFASILKDTYIKDPCKVLPNAIWKTRDRLDKIECFLTKSEYDVKQLEGWDKNGLHIFWNEARYLDSDVIDRIKASDFAIIHDDYFQKIDNPSFKLIKPYFRILSECKETHQYSLDDRFSIVDVNTDTELKEVSELICKCYENIHPSVETVTSWTKNKVFDNRLWIWIMDKSINKPVALGIAELDKSIPEGSLEWIQVLPEYQGRGLGRVLVLELLNRMNGKARFVTVSGEVDNLTNPERLYRSCGFYGSDVWWLMRK